MIRQSLTSFSRQSDPGSLYARLVTVTDALTDTALRAEMAESALKERLSQIDELQSSLSKKSDFAESVEKQLVYANEHNRLLVGEISVLQADAQAVGTALARSDSELQRSGSELEGVRDRISELDQENRGLQLESSEQADRLKDLAERHDRLEQSVVKERKRAEVLEDRLVRAVEIAKTVGSRAKADAASHRAERAGLLMKLASAEGDKASAEQGLAQLRDRLQEKDEARRAEERGLRDARLAQEAAERRLEGAKAEIARQEERVRELQQQRAEIAARADTLAETLSAKEASLERLAAENARVTGQVAEIAGRHEAALKELETVAQTHSAELERERSERALIHRALEIARASRLALQRQHDAARQAPRGWRDAPEEDAAAQQDSNVHPLYGVR